MIVSRRISPHVSAFAHNLLFEPKRVTTQFQYFKILLMSLGIVANGFRWSQGGRAMHPSPSSIQFPPLRWVGCWRSCSAVCRRDSNRPWLRRRAHGPPVVSPLVTPIWFPHVDMFFSWSEDLILFSVSLCSSHPKWVFSVSPFLTLKSLGARNLHVGPDEHRTESGPGISPHSKRIKPPFNNWAGGTRLFGPFWPFLGLGYKVTPLFAGQDQDQNYFLTKKYGLSVIGTLGSDFLGAAR